MIWSKVICLRDEYLKVLPLCFLNTLVSNPQTICVCANEQETSIVVHCFCREGDGEGETERLIFLILERHCFLFRKYTDCQDSQNPPLTPSLYRMAQFIIICFLVCCHSVLENRKVVDNICTEIQGFPLDWHLLAEVFLSDSG